MMVVASRSDSNDTPVEAEASKDTGHCSESDAGKDRLKCSLGDIFGASDHIWHVLYRAG